MRFGLTPRETLGVLLGMLGLLEQEMVRLVFDLDPNSILSGIFGTMVLGSIGVGVVRASLPRNGKNGTTGDDSENSRNGGERK